MDIVQERLQRLLEHPSQSPTLVTTEDIHRWSKRQLAGAGIRTIEMAKIQPKKWVRMALLDRYYDIKIKHAR